MPNVAGRELCVVCQTADEAEIAAGRPGRGCLWRRQTEDVTATDPAHVLEEKKVEFDYEAMQRGCPPYFESLTPVPIDSTVE